MSQDPHTRPHWIWLGRSRASAAPTDETVGLGTTGLGNCFFATCEVSAKFFRHGSGGNWTALPPWRLLGPSSSRSFASRVYSTRFHRTLKVCSIRIQCAALGEVGANVAKPGCRRLSRFFHFRQFWEDRFLFSVHVVAGDDTTTVEEHLRTIHEENGGHA